MGRRAKPAKVKAEAKRPFAREAPKQDAPGIHELEKRLAEALEQQTATAEILRVISGSPTDVQPVLNAVAENATRVCEAGDGVVLLIDGGAFRVAAHYGTIIALPHDEAIPINRGTVPGRAILERAPVHVPDLLAAGDDFPEGRVLGARFGNRTTLATPLLREGTPIGALLIRRPEVRPFSDKQIKLLQTFAAQAVIAIENTRLFNETKEALEQQTATAEILRVISGSLTDTQPVFEAIVRNCGNLFKGSRVVLWLISEDWLHARAIAGAAESQVLGDKVPIDRESAIGACVLDARMIHLPDLKKAAEQYPRIRQLGLKWGYHSGIYAPLLREGRAIGGIAVLRREAGAFDDKEVALLNTFADQAVIAIENVRLFKELQARNVEVTESLEQQTVTAEILRVISSSPTNLQPVFDAILENATRLCDGHIGNLGLYDGEKYQNVAQRGGNAEYAKYVLERGPFRPSPGGGLGRMIAERQPNHVADRRDSPEYRDRLPGTVELVELGGARTYIAVPMLKEGRVVGGISIYRPEVRPFTQKQIDLVSTFANQAVIAIENVRLFNETKEALEQQTATADILRVISSSPTDLQPVFDTILEHATRLCEAHLGLLGLYDGEKYHTVAQRGGNADFAKWVIARGPYEPDAGGGMAGMIAQRQPIHIPDLREGSSYRDHKPNAVQLVEVGGARSYITVPMLKEGRVVGGITIYRPEVRPFTQKQIDLVSTFANQAVIAIENVRLFNETKEALEQQTVISEILRVISSSPTDVQPVFDAIVKSGLHLFGGMNVSLRLVKGDHIETVASTLSIHDTGGVFRVPLDDESTPAPRAILRREVVQIPDILAPEDWVSARAKHRAGQRGWRALMCAPMQRESNAIGVISVSRAAPGLFTDKEVALLKTFADQAVIAIENVRLFNETKEALEQQTATADILSVISSSPTDLQPVFDAILEKAIRLCDAHMGHLHLYDGEKFQNVAQRGANPEYARFLSERGPFRPPPGSGVARMLAKRQPIHIEDRRDSPEYRDGVPNVVALVELGGARTYIVVPMLKEGRVVGCISIYRPEVRPFTQKQIDLLSTFASQAVIAIENARLFNEINEALQRQTSIAEILRVISSTPTDVMPVLEAVTHRAAQLCDAPDARLFLVDGNALKYVVGFGELKGVIQSLPLTRGSVVGRAIIDQSVVHIEDVAAALDEFPDAREPQRLFGHRTTLAVPLVRENMAFGGILMRRKEVRPFSEKQIELVKTFADQAVIAIHNVRLFKEINEALERQTATSEVLKVISRSTFDLEPVLESLVENARKLCNADRATISRADKDGNYVSVIERTLEPSPGFLAYMQRHPIRPDRGSAVGRAVLERRPVHIPDILADPEYKRLDLAEVRSFRTVLAVPMLREGEPIGVFVLTRDKEVKPFTEKQVELVTTFADQAVIAIENVRLFNEIQDKSRQLEVASRHKSQFLANMSHELRTPLNAILGYTELILDGIYGDVSAKVRDVMGRVDKSGRHLLGLINDVLDLSKIEAGQLTLSLADYSLADVVQTVFTALGSLAAEKKLALKIALASELPRGRGDDRRLTQVLLNLVGNAIKFTDSGEVRLEARCSDDAFVVSVADTGPGISEADQQRIFEEFQQVDDSATRKKGGTGLGLSIARRIIELHGGRIQVESAPGRGATFTVTLPVRVERQAGPI